MLDKHPIVLAIDLVAGVAGGRRESLGGVGRRVLMAEIEVCPVARSLRELLRVLDRHIKADELAHEQAPTAGRPSAADGDQLPHENCAIGEFSVLLVQLEVVWVDVHVMELGERSSRRIERVGSCGRAHKDPFPIAFRSKKRAPLTEVRLGQPSLAVFRRPDG